MDSPQSWIRPYYGSFNGLRGLAVALVFLAHFGGSLERITSQTLWVGVDLFFVLSGFLITGILYDSLDSPHYFRYFYVRRALRIFPIFYGFFLLLLLLKPILHLQMDRGMLAFVFYFGNLTVPFTNLDLHNPTMVRMVIHGRLFQIGNLGHLWSLCVEEQFYLVWPAIVWWVRDRRKLMAVSVGVSAVALVLRFYLRAHASDIELSQDLIYWSTYTRCDTLLIGAWLALFLRGNKLSLSQLRRSSASLFWISVGALAFGVYRWRGHSIMHGPFMETAGYTLTALAAMGVLLRSLDDDSLLSKMLRFRPLSGLGVISYGFYFYHSIPAYPWHHLADVHPGLTNVVPLMAFASTVAIAWLSFRYFESPFLRLKSVLAPQQRQGTAKGNSKLHLSQPSPSV